MAEPIGGVLVRLRLRRMAMLFWGLVTDRVSASYWIETAFPVEQAAAIMAGEQSTGTFVRVPGETDELRERHAARIEGICEHRPVDAPSLPGAGLPKGLAGPPVYRQAEVRLSWPLANMGMSLPQPDGDGCR